MKRIGASLLLAGLALVLLDSATRADLGAQGMDTDVPEHDASDAAAAAVTEENLLENERFWPYQVALSSPFQPPGGGAAVPAGTSGVLIRVEPDERARIDFGRNGLYTLPVGSTDLVARANQVRQGELEKMAANLTLAIGPRLVDSSGEKLRPLRFRAATTRTGFLCVFADLKSPRLRELAAALAPLHDRHDVMTIFFPQGEYPDDRVRRRLRKLKWEVPFVYDHLSESYTRTLLPEGALLPRVLLQTDEGRVVFDGAWGDDIVAALTSALDQSFGPSDHAGTAGRS